MTMDEEETVHSRKVRFGLELYKLGYRLYKLWNERLNFDPIEFNLIRATYQSLVNDEKNVQYNTSPFVRSTKRAIIKLGSDYEEYIEEKMTNADTYFVNMLTVTA